MKGLKVKDLQVFLGERQVIKGISFEIPAGARVGLIGESGSGKSVTALSLMGLLGEGVKTTGSVSLDGKELLSLPDRQMAQLRGSKIGMIFQEPMTALDPTMRVGKQVAEVLTLHQRGRRGKRQEVIKMLGRVGLPDPEQNANAFPHQLSGGQRQRVMMAMALINAPQLLICDEPTTALDVTVQAKVLRLLDKELTETASACLFISHDLAVVNQICDYLLVMHQGQIVERGPLRQVLAQPKHPYTRGLLATADIAAVKPGARLPVLSDFFRGNDE
ncbi:ATP-binding cassette domain-containing protein [Varibaculum vaginae]|uniref:ATP-binding cassette domain-containing protein n=1 Tax=Varibaculum vaginae TaxID=2364797 RepID=UPI000F094AAE|nr:ABC transporter ATP-binding protein [Varibaculum vaginae]